MNDSDKKCDVSKIHTMARTPKEENFSKVNSNPVIFLQNKQKNTNGDISVFSEAESFVAWCDDLYFMSYVTARIWGESISKFSPEGIRIPFLEVIIKELDGDYTLYQSREYNPCA